MTTEDSIAEPLAQAAHLTFGLPHRFTAPEAWPTTTSRRGAAGPQIYSGGWAKETHMPLPRSRR